MDSLHTHTKLVHYIARKWWGSFEKAGMGVEYEDLVQEGFVVCINALSKFDASLGWAFSTYYVTCANHHYASLHKRMGRGASVSLNALTEDDLSLMDALEDPGQNPELECIASDTMAGAFDDLSELAKMMFKMLTSPPNAVRQQFEAIEAKRQLARKLGIDERHPPEINLAFVSSLLAATGFKAKDLAVAREQIRELELAHAV